MSSEQSNVPESDKSSLEAWASEYLEGVCIDIYIKTSINQWRAICVVERGFFIVRCSPQPSFQFYDFKGLRSVSVVKNRLLFGHQSYTDSTCLIEVSSSDEEGCGLLEGIHNKILYHMYVFNSRD